MNVFMLMGLLSRELPIPIMPPRSKWQAVGDAIILILWALAAATGKAK